MNLLQGDALLDRHRQAVWEFRQSIRTCADNTSLAVSAGTCIPPDIFDPASSSYNSAVRSWWPQRNTQHIHQQCHSAGLQHCKHQLASFPASSVMSLHSPRAVYDFTAAITSLSDKIQELSRIKQQQLGGSGILNSGLRYWRKNKSSLFFIFTMYSVSAGAVLAAMMSESRLQSEQLHEAQEQQQMQQHIDRLQQQAQQQQQMLDSLRLELQQYRGSWWGLGKFRQQLLDRLQQWHQQEVQHEPGPLKHQERHDADATSYEREFGVRVGKLGQGFFI